MTRPEITGIRDLKMSQWIRKNLPDSGFGFFVTDLDWIFYNISTRKIMLMEVKTRNKNMKFWQQQIFKNLEKWIKNGIDSDWDFLGFHILTFENTFFDDGKVYLDGKEITEECLKNFLSKI